MNTTLNHSGTTDYLSTDKANQLAFILRLGLGAVFIIGGLSKLSLLLDSASHDGMVANYMSTSGYINALFQQFLFNGYLGNVLSPSGFLIGLSSFELCSGIALVIGFLVRSLSLLYAFLLWAFVIALPTMTVPGLDISEKTYTSPAIFVQIRDIGLSGMMFVLFNLGAGRYSVDGRFLQQQITIKDDTVALLLRLSLGVVFVVAGFFSGFANIQSFSTTPLLLIIISLTLLFGSATAVRITGAVVIVVMLWFIVNKFSVDKSLIKNFNGFKREFALMAAGVALAYIGGGKLFTLSDMLSRTKCYLSLYFPKKTA